MGIKQKRVSVFANASPFSANSAVAVLKPQFTVIRLYLTSCLRWI